MISKAVIVTLLQLHQLSHATQPSSPIRSSSRTTTITTINESYKSNLSSQEIAQSIRRQIHQSFAQKQEEVDSNSSSSSTNVREIEEGIEAEEEAVKESKIEIDVSCSMLKDEGIDIIINSLLMKGRSSSNGGGESQSLSTEEQKMLLHNDDEEEEEVVGENRKDSSIRPIATGKSIISMLPPLSIEFQARMNKITLSGIASFFNKLIAIGEEQQQHQKQVQYDNVTTDTVTSNTDHNNINITSTTDSTNATVSTLCTSMGDGRNETRISQEENLETKNYTHPTIHDNDDKDKYNDIYMESIDIGLNDFGLHGIGRRNIQKFLQSIQKLIENQSGLVCPFVLRMDNCGLGPLSCRYIGKVSLFT